LRSVRAAGRLIPWIGPLAVLLAQAPIPDRIAAILGLTASLIGVPLAAWPLLGRWTRSASQERNPAAGMILTVAGGAVLLPLPHLLLTALGFAGVPLSILAILLILTTVVLATLSFRVAGPSVESTADEVRPEGRGQRGLAMTVTLVVTLLVALRLGTPLGSMDDALDHLATIRHLVDSNRVEFPGAFYGRDEPAGVDIRKGVTHVALAIATVVSHVDPILTWESSATLLAPLAAAAFLSLTLALASGFAPATWLALPGLLLFTGDSTWIFKSAYGGHAGLALAWAILAGFLSGWGWRWALVAGAAAASVHAYAPVQVLAPLLGFRLLMLIPAGGRREVTGGPTVPSLAGLAAFLLGSLPVEAARWLLAAGGRNPLHEQSMAWLQLGPGPVASPIQLIGWFGLAGVVAMLVALVLALVDDRRSHRYLAATVLVPVSLLLNPWLLASVGDRFGSVANKLALVWSPALAFVLLAAAAIHPDNRKWLRMAAGSATALLLLTGWSSFPAALNRITRPGEPGPESLPNPVAGAINRLLPTDAVIASDPITSYAIPAMTGRRVIVTLHQHSPPGDVRAAERLAVAATLGSTCVPLEEALARCQEEGAGWLVFNPTSRRRLDEFAAHRDPRNNTELSARFHPIPGRLDLVTVVEGFQIYRINGQAIISPAPRPAPVMPLSGPPANSVRVSQRELELAVESLPRDSRARRGESISLPASWRVGGAMSDAAGKLAYREVEAHIRFEHEDVGRIGMPGPFSKLHRRLVVEPGLGGSLRARGVELPFRGLCSPAEWPRGEWLQDSLQLTVPSQIIPGRYRLELSLDEVELYPVLTLADLFSDEDRHEGPEIGWMTIE